VTVEMVKDFETVPSPFPYIFMYSEIPRPYIRTV